MRIERYKRFWAVRDEAGELICLCVYRKGANEVLRRLTLPSGEGTPHSTVVLLPSQY